MKEALSKSPALRAILKEELEKKNIKSNNQNKSAKSLSTNKKSSNEKKWWQFWK